MFKLLITTVLLINGAFAFLPYAPIPPPPTECQLDDFYKHLEDPQADLIRITNKCQLVGGYLPNVGFAKLNFFMQTHYHPLVPRIFAATFQNHGGNVGINCQLLQHIGLARAIAGQSIYSSAMVHMKRMDYGFLSALNTYFGYGSRASLSQLNCLLRQYVAKSTAAFTSPQHHLVMRSALLQIYGPVIAILDQLAPPRFDCNLQPSVTNTSPHESIIISLMRAISNVANNLL